MRTLLYVLACLCCFVVLLPVWVLRVGWNGDVVKAGFGACGGVSRRGGSSMALHVCLWHCMSVCGRGGVRVLAVGVSCCIAGLHSIEPLQLRPCRVHFIRPFRVSSPGWTTA